MPSVTLNCRIITPMFIAGADGRTPELRPSTFKGMMRFWWRAMKAKDDLNNLREEEAEIFGGTGDKEGKSKVMIKVYPQPSKNFLGENLKTDFGLEWRFNRNTNILEGKDAGIGYVLYSTVLPQRERQYIKPDFQFSIKLSSYNEEFFKNALASLWTAIYLGGFGTRARRGAGNIVVEEINGSSYELDFIPEVNTDGELFFWLKSNLNKCFSIINRGMIKNFCTDYSNLSFSRIILSNQLFTDWKSALNDIGKIYIDFRQKYRGEIFDTAVFGLPVVHRNVTVEGLKGGEKFLRRSSPIVFKLIKSGDKFFWYLIRLSGEFLEEGAVIKAHKTQKPHFKLIDEFWNQLKNRGKEFILSQPQILNKTIEKIKTELNPEAIVLFGSRARGDAHKKADIDIAIKNPQKPMSLLEINGPFDIIDLNRSSQEFKNKIEKEGITIYEKPIKKND